MTTNAEWLERDKASLAEVLPIYFDIFIEKGEGSWVIDVEGNRYLDFSSGIAVTSLGHCHPAVVEAITKQASTLIHTSVVTRNTPKVELAEKLVASVPYIKDAQVFFCNTGAEAVDGALKLARKVTHRSGVIAFRRAFHGRTLAGTSLTTARGKYRNGYEPLLPGVYVAPYCMDGNAEAALAQLDELLSLQAPEDNIGAMIVEPVLGEGGYVPPPAAWLQGLRERCNERGILLVFDEVQTGIGRTGAMFAAETYGVAPDVILFAKGIANGLPLGGIIAPRELMSKWPTGAHGTTFGGNPVACAAANATLDVIKSENLLPRVKQLGERVSSQLRSINAPSVVEVRGLGLMVGIEFVDNPAAERVQEQCFDEGLLLLVCGAEENVIRMIPALNISDDDLSHGMNILTKALTT